MSRRTEQYVVVMTQKTKLHCMGARTQIRQTSCWHCALYNGLSPLQLLNQRGFKPFKWACSPSQLVTMLAVLVMAYSVTELVIPSPAGTCTTIQVGLVHSKFSSDVFIHNLSFLVTPLISLRTHPLVPYSLLLLLLMSMSRSRTQEWVIEHLFMQLPMRPMRMCFTGVFFCFLLFPSATKIPDNHSRELLNGFSWNFY